MTEATGKAAAEAAEDAAETIIELVETVPMWALALAFVAGGIVVAMMMLAVSKPPAAPSE